LLGLENHVWLAVNGLSPAGARFDTRQISTDRLSAVQYVKFPLTPEQATRFAGGARIVVDHPSYTVERPFTPQELEELAADLV
jgi:hypothetical protein